MAAPYTLGELADLMNGKTVRGRKGGLPGDINRKMGQIQAKIALDIYRAILQRWPVDTGYSRANWLLSLDRPERKIKPAPARAGRKGSVGPAELQEAQSITSKLDGSERTAWLTNNVPYAHILEYQGTSSQAPNGVVRIAIANVLGKARSLKIRI